MIEWTPSPAKVRALAQRIWPDLHAKDGRVEWLAQQVGALLENEHVVAALPPGRCMSLAPEGFPRLRCSRRSGHRDDHAYQPSQEGAAVTWPWTAEDL